MCRCRGGHTPIRVGQTAVRFVIVSRARRAARSRPVRPVCPTPRGPHTAWVSRPVTAAQCRYAFREHRSVFKSAVRRHNGLRSSTDREAESCRHPRPRLRLAHCLSHTRLGYRGSSDRSILRLADLAPKVGRPPSPLSERSRLSASPRAPHRRFSAISVFSPAASLSWLYGPDSGFSGVWIARCRYSALALPLWQNGFSDSRNGGIPTRRLSHGVAVAWHAQLHRQYSFPAFSNVPIAVCRQRVLVAWLFLAVAFPEQHPEQRLRAHSLFHERLQLLGREVFLHRAMMEAHIRPCVTGSKRARRSSTLRSSSCPVAKDPRSNRAHVR